MIKKCNVLLSNEAVCVVDFGGEHIQMPALKNIKSNCAFVTLNDGIYLESTEDEYTESLTTENKEINTSQKDFKKRNNIL